MSKIAATTSLLVNARTEGLNVKSRDGDQLGTLYALMIDKRTGLTTYAILSIGGFLGMNRSYYPLPFDHLAYDPIEDGYVVTTDRRVLEGGPSWANNPPEFNQAYAERVTSYYGAPGENATAL